MDSLRWTILNHEATFPPGGGFIWCVTDRPVSLTMQWTALKFRMHLRLQLKRGKLFLADPYFCFVQYTAVNQLETIDTLDHSFILPDWPIMEFRQWNFIGTVDGVPSPSSSPIFTATRQPTPAAAPLSAYPIFQRPPSLVRHTQIAALLSLAHAPPLAPLHSSAFLNVPTPELFESQVRALYTLPLPLQGSHLQVTFSVSRPPVEFQSAPMEATFAGVVT